MIFELLAHLVVAILRPGVQDYMSSFLNFLVVAILIFDRSLVRLVVRSWHLEFFARLFDLCSVWWCDLDILNFLLCPFIWSLFHLVVRSWHLELFARLFDLGGAILTSWTFCPFIWSWWCDLDILNFLPVYLIFVLFDGVILYFIIRTTGVRSSCDLDNILKSEWDRDYRSSCDLDILNYELIGPFSGWLRSWYYELFWSV